jgi:ComEC/Rec2-related protein
MKRPLLPPALLYIAGLWLGAIWPMALPGLFLLAMALILLSMASARLRRVSLASAILIVGWFNMASRLAILSPHDLRDLLGERTAIVTLRGVLAESPIQRLHGPTDAPLGRTHAVIAVSALRTGDRWQPATGLVAAIMPGVLSANFFSGCAVEVAGVMRSPPGAPAPGLFDYRAHLRWQGIHHQLVTDDIRDWRLLENASREPPAADRFISWAQGALARGLPEEDETLRLIWAMALGWKTAFTNEIATPFMRSGTMHVFAISGLHIALIAGILVTLLRALRVPRAACGLVALPLLWFYTGATGWQSSAIRSAVMMSVVIGGWVLKRPGDLVNSLAAAALVILVWDPRQLFQAGFQLSFSVVLSLALLLPLLEPWRQRLLAPDPFLPDSGRPRWRRWIDAPMRWLSLGAAVSVVAWVGSVPLIAHYFHLFTPVSLLANLVVVPLSSLELMCNLGSLLCEKWLPCVAELFNHAGWLWMFWMDRVSQWCARLPGACYHLRAPTAVELIAYYTLLLSVAGGAFSRPRGRRVLGAFLGVLALLWIWQWHDTRNQVELTLFSGAIYSDLPGRQRDLLVDAGDANSAGFVLKPFLQSKGMNRLPPIVLTHGDARHYGGIEMLEKGFTLATVLTSPIPSSSQNYRKLMLRLEAMPTLATDIRHGNQIGGWHVLHPAQTDRFERGDDNAIVLHGEFHGIRVLLLSDLGQAGQAALLSRKPNLRTEIVVSGIPDQGEPLSDALLSSLGPQMVVIADAKVPARERAPPALQQRLAAHGIPVLYVSQSGSITLTLRRSGWEVTAMDGTRLHFTAR